MNMDAINMEDVRVHANWFKIGFQFACGFACAQMILMLVALALMSVIG